MTREIAVHTSRRGETAAINESGTILVYRQQMGIWGVERQLAFTLKQDKGLREMRSQMAEVIEFLENCKIFVASSITGVPYYELERIGCSVWEFAGKPVDFLEYIIEKEDEAEQEQLTAQAKPVIIPIPEHIGNGHYRLSIKAVQEADSGVTTKQILMPFLKKGNFYQLEIICNHVPPWLELEAMTGSSLVYEAEKIGPGEIKAILRKRVCTE